MAIISVQRDRPAQREEVNKTDQLLDRIAKGLSIVSNVYGIKTQSEQSDLRKLQQQQIEQEMKQSETKEARSQAEYEAQPSQYLTQSEFNKQYIEVDRPQFESKYGSMFPLTQVAVGQDGEPKWAIDKDSLKAITDVQKKEQLAQTKPKEQKASAAQFVAKGYAERLAEADQQINELMKPGSGFERTSRTESAKAGVLNLLGPFGEPLKSEGLKSWEQAQSNFINAVLRRESGAAIAESEFEKGEKQYFPVAGDTQKLVDQKRKNRETVIAAMAREAAGDISLGQQEVLAKARQDLIDRQSGGLLPTQRTMLGGFAPAQPALMDARETDDDFVRRYLNK
jgi:hypothetical protein